MKQKVALVLSSGGARGIAHIGAIRELLSQGYEITSISGSSMGALIGGVYAAGKLDEYEEWLCSLDKIDVFKLIDFTLSKSGIIKAQKVLDEMKMFIPDRNIEDLPVKYNAITTDLTEHSEVVLSKGSLYNAIRASISIPAVFTPLQTDNSIFIDGGVLNPIPTNRVIREDGDILIAVNVNAYTPKNEGPKPIRNWSYYDVVGGTVGLMLSQITKLTLKINPPDVLVEISRDAYEIYDFYKAHELIELGKNNTRKELVKYTRQVNSLL